MDLIHPGWTILESPELFALLTMMHIQKSEFYLPKKSAACLQQ